MHDVVIRFTKGSMKGQVFQHTLGGLVIGRGPVADRDQETLVLVGASESVSRSHTLLHDRDGEVIVENLGANGTKVDGKLNTDAVAITTGAKISIGSQHEFIVSWQLIGSQGESEDTATTAETVGKSGLLASPMVRVILAVYILGIVGIAAYLSLAVGKGGNYQDDWPELAARYEAYQPEGLGAEQKAARASRAEAILVKLRVLKTNDQHREVKQLCRELMSLDSDIKSPMYQYGAKCLGEVN